MECERSTVARPRTGGGNAIAQATSVVTVATVVENMEILEKCSSEKPGKVMEFQFLNPVATLVEVGAAIGEPIMRH